jgi:hypothetical protein
MNNAYRFAYIFGMTTKQSIKMADMWWKLTRIAMAKMLSKYAIKVLWMKPDTRKIVQFMDVDEALNKKYDNWVTLAYQLWIMGQWISRFRPQDLVTRAEFATALSRMLYKTKDSYNLYYASHINKLKEEWIINNTYAPLQEQRWYVMVMLLRSAMKNNLVEIEREKKG